MTMNTNRMIELALVFFVSLLSFSIGTYVGKKYSDNQHRLALLEPKSQNKDVAQADVVDHGTEAAHANTPNPEKSSHMTDADVAKLAEEFASEDDTAAENPTNTKNISEINEPTAHVAKTTAATVTAAPATEKTKNLTTTAAIEKIKQAHDTKAVSTSQNLQRDVASIAEKAKTIGSAFYTVQVGAYPTAADAEKMTESLKAHGYKASSTQALVNGKTWHRVQVGLFDNIQSAQEYKKELIEKNRLTSAIIQKIQQQ